MLQLMHRFNVATYNNGGYYDADAFNVFLVVWSDADPGIHWPCAAVVGPTSLCTAGTCLIEPLPVRVSLCVSHWTNSLRP